MSKSKGNVVVPAEPIDNHGADAVRYWAASARLGTDAAFDEGQMKIGRRLAIKLLNASKFALSFEPTIKDAKVTEAIDQSLLLNLAQVVEEATKAFENYDHTKALEVAEHFFWNFTDNYLELVKERAYGHGDYTAEQQSSAAIALRKALHVQLRLFAPFLPFATDEVWSWWQSSGSIHNAAWPTKAELVEGLDGSNLALLELAKEALFGLRKAKSDAQVSMKAAVESATLSAPAEILTDLRLLDADFKAVGKIETLAYEAGESLAVTDVVLAAAEEN
jgi:valyl-tRNA synthetase